MSKYMILLFAMQQIKILCNIKITAVNIFNPLTPELNPSEHRRLPEFFTGDFKF